MLPVLGKSLGHPLLHAPMGSLVKAARLGVADDILKTRPGDGKVFDARIKQIAVAAVAKDQPVIGIVKGESLGDALDGFGQLGFCPFSLLARQGQLLGSLLAPEFQIVPRATQLRLIGLLTCLHLVEGSDDDTDLVLAVPVYRVPVAALLGPVDRAEQAFERNTDRPAVGDEGAEHDSRQEERR